MPEPASDHRQCRYVKMDGVRCGRAVPTGHVHCYMHRFNRDPSFVVHHGTRRVPLLEDVASLQVTTTAAIHGLLNRSLDAKEVRVILAGVNTAAGLLRVDLAEKRWLAQTGQTRPEPVTDFAVVDHEHLAVEDPLPAAAEPASQQASQPCSTHDPLGSSWPCPQQSPAQPPSDVEAPAPHEAPPQLALPDPEVLPPSEPFSECEPESVYDSAPPSESLPAMEPESALLPVLTASADAAKELQRLPVGPRPPAQRCYQRPPAESATSTFDAPFF